MERPWLVYVNGKRRGGRYATVPSARKAAEALLPGLRWLNDYDAADDRGNVAYVIHAHGWQADLERR